MTTPAPAPAPITVTVATEAQADELREALNALAITLHERGEELARVDGQARGEAVVPLVMDLAGVEAMGLKVFGDGLYAVVGTNLHQILGANSSTSRFAIAP